MANTAALVLTGLVLVATLGPCSAQGFFKPTSTPGSYGTVTEEAPKWDLPTWNFTKATKPPKVMLPAPGIPGLTFDGIGKKKINLNMTMFLGNLTHARADILNRIPNLNGIMLVGECPIDETHVNCAQCQLSFTMMYTSECVACNEPFVLDKTTKLCGCPVGYASLVDPASHQNTCIQQIYYGGIHP